MKIFLGEGVALQGYELRALCSVTSPMPPTLFASVIFQIEYCAFGSVGLGTVILLPAPPK
jgi:hypothetical protein